MHMTLIRPKRSHSAAGRGASGYALLEAMVAVLVAAVGFIGAARMQTLGMTLGSSAQSRQKATLLGYQMTDRIRANRMGFDAGNYNSPANNGATTCLGSGCTPALLAAADVAQWAAEVAATLPKGAAVVCRDSSPSDGTYDGVTVTPACDNSGDVIAVKIWWIDNVATTQFVTMVRP